MSFSDWEKKLGLPASGPVRSLTVGQVLQAEKHRRFIAPGFRRPARRMYFTYLIRMVHESHLSDDDYPYLPEHMMAPTLDQLANRTELLDQLAQALPLTEAAEILGPAYQTYLWQMCLQHAHPRMHSDSAKSPALALPYAEAMIATKPTGDEGREIRAYCRARLEPVDYAALLADYN